jgi:hypothetical protein
MAGSSSLGERQSDANCEVAARSRRKRTLNLHLGRARRPEGAACRTSERRGPDSDWTHATRSGEDAVKSLDKAYRGVRHERGDDKNRRAERSGKDHLALHEGDCHNRILAR